jgi:hypothetical protein
VKIVIKILNAFPVTVLMEYAVTLPVRLLVGLAIYLKKFHPKKKEHVLLSLILHGVLVFMVARQRSTPVAALMIYSVVIMVTVFIVVMMVGKWHRGLVTVISVRLMTHYMVKYVGGKEAGDKRVLKFVQVMVDV